MKHAPLMRDAPLSANFPSLSERLPRNVIICCQRRVSYHESSRTPVISSWSHSTRSISSAKAASVIHDCTYAIKLERRPNHLERKMQKSFVYQRNGIRLTCRHFNAQTSPEIVPRCVKTIKCRQKLPLAASK